MLCALGDAPAAASLRCCLPRTGADPSAPAVSCCPQQVLPSGELSKPQNELPALLSISSCLCPADGHSTVSLLPRTQPLLWVSASTMPPNPDSIFFSGLVFWVLGMLWGQKAAGRWELRPAALSHAVAIRLARRAMSSRSASEAGQSTGEAPAAQFVSSALCHCSAEKQIPLRSGQSALRAVPAVSGEKWTAAEVHRQVNGSRRCAIVHNWISPPRFSRNQHLFLAQKPAAGLAESGGFKAGTARRSRSPRAPAGLRGAPAPQSSGSGEGQSGEPRPASSSQGCSLRAPSQAAKASRCEAARRGHTAKPSSG